MMTYCARRPNRLAGRSRVWTMAKLKALQSRIGSMPPKIGYANAAVQSAARDRTQRWRQWYRSDRWKKLRERVFVRDGFVCQETGELLTGKAPAPNSPVAHHKVAHRGDEALFWDERNLETVSKRWHDTVAQAQERAEAIGSRR